MGTAAFIAVAGIRMPSRAAPPMAPAISQAASQVPASAQSALERAVLDEVNRLRSDPAGFARELAAERRWFKGFVLERPGRSAVQTIEGPASLDEAIRVLRTATPVPRLEPSEGLARAARAHASDLGTSGTRGHVGTNGDGWRDRLEQQGRFEGLAGEVISYGQSDATEIVRQWIVDDGVPDRGHRENLLRAEFRVAGVACRSHRTLRSVCVIDLATTFTIREDDETPTWIL